MSDKKEDFALYHPVKNEEARKRLGIKAGFFWITAKKLSVAVSRCIAAMDDKGYDEDDFKKPVRVNFPVVNDLPPEGVFDTDFCNRYEKGGDDGLTMVLIPGAVPVDQFHAQNKETPNNTGADAGRADDETGEVPEDHTETFGNEDNAVKPGDLPAYAYNVNGELMEEVSKEANQPVVRMSERHRILSQFILNDAFSHHVTPEQLAEVSRLELDMSNSYIQDMLLACHNVPAILKLDTPNLWKFTDAFKRIFPQDKQHTLHLMMNFAQAFSDTEYIDRGLLVKEWQKGNRVSRITRNASGANAGGGIKTDRNPDYTHTLETLDYEIAAATLPMDFDIYNIPLSIHRRTKEIIAKRESSWKEWSAALRATPGILDYSRAAIFALIRGTSSELVKYPGRLRAYINASLTESNHEKPTEEILVAARQINSAAVTLEAVKGAIDGHKETLIPDGVGEEYAVVGKKLIAEARSRTEQPGIENLGNGVFSLENLVNTPPAQPLSVVDQLRQHSAEEKMNGDIKEEIASDVQMEESGNDETKAGIEVPPGETATSPDESTDSVGEQTDTLNNETAHQNIGQISDKLYSHLMVDLETMGDKPNAPVVSIGAVFFDPSTGDTGAEFYKVVSLESAMACGGKPDASTIIWWMKQSSEARSAIVMDDAIPLDDALLQLNDFIAENAANGPASVQVWGNGASFDNVILRDSYARTGIDYPCKYWNDRDVRTMVELGKAVGINPRDDIRFEGDMHNALSDARHQAKYVSVIWQRLAA